LGVQWVGVRVQEQKDNDTGNRNVEPNRKGKTRNAAMGFEPAREREKESDQDHGQGDDGKNHMAGQNGKVQGAHRSVPRKERVAVQRVIGDVTDQKNRRKYERKKHAITMRFPVAMFDEVKADAKCDRARAIQERVESGEKHPATGEIRGSVMNVKQPQQERDSETAHHDDRAKHRARTDSRFWHPYNINTSADENRRKLRLSSTMRLHSRITALAWFPVIF
jgi:hypothetical protein